MAIGDVVGYSNQVEIPGLANIIHEDPLNQATYGNHCELATTGTPSILAVYNDVTNAKGMARIGTRVSDFCIEWGTAVQFNAAAVSNIIPVRVSDTKFLLFYTDTATTYLTCIAGTVAGTVPTLGTKVALTGNIVGTPIGAVYMNTDSVMVAYAAGTTNGQAMMVALTGTTVTYGTAAIFKATTNIVGGGGTTLTQLCSHSTTLATVVYYVSATVTQCVTMTVSGTTITVNTAGLAAFGGSANLQFPSIGALSATTFVVAYTDVTDTGKGNAQVGTISGTTITAGASEYAFDTGNDSSNYRIPCVAVISSTMFSIVFGSTTQYQTLICMGTVAATVITFTGATGIAISNDYTYEYATSSPRIYLTFTKSGQLTFSYLAVASNSPTFLCGMAEFSGVSITVREMCFRLAVAASTENVEVSSIYIQNNKNRAQNTDYMIGLYINGTMTSNRYYYNAYGDQFLPVQAASYCLPMTLGSNPVVVAQNQSLFASLKMRRTQAFKGSGTVFGLKRTVA